MIYMREKITFLHAADLHLDSPFRGLSHLPENIFQDVYQSTFKALNHLVELAIETPVDFVLLVGDLFDAEKQTVQSQIKLRQAFQKLDNANIPIYLSYGNHDYLEGNQHRVTFPENTHIFDSETVSTFIYEKNQTKVNISGFSYAQRVVLDEKALEFPKNNTRDQYHLGMYHGSIDGQVEHDHYAPFRLSQLNEKHYDYWALGHIHKRQVLQTEPPVIYPGNIQGRHRNEAGEKGCYIVTLDDQTSQFDFYPLSELHFAEFTIDLDDYETLDDLEQACREKLDRYVRQKTLVTCSFLHSNTHTIFDAQLIDQLVESLNEQFLTDHWQYIYKYKLELAHQEMPAYPEPFQKEMLEAMTLEEAQLAVGQLTKKRQVKEILSIDEAEILELAKLNIERLFS